MTRFDAPASSPSVLGSLGRAAGGLLAARFGMILATLALTILGLFAAVSMVGILIAAPVALQQAFVSSPVLVVLSPAVSRTDVEALRPRLTALPSVASAVLRPKEEALAALVAAGLPAPPDGRNPLPDVWAVTLRGSGPSFTTEAVTARDELRALPGVEVVRFDEAWAGALDRGAAAWSRFGVASVAGVLVAVGVALFCVYALFGRTLVSMPSAGTASLAAMLAVCAGVVVLAAVIDYAALRLVVASLNSADGSAVQPMALSAGLNITKTVVGVASVALLIAGCGAATSRLG